MGRCKSLDLLKSFLSCAPQLSSAYSQRSMCVCVYIYKICLVKAMVFLAVIYGCNSWTIKKVERQRIDAFELWYRRQLIRVPWTARR